MASSVDKQYRKKVAIVGSGSAGVAALWALNRTHHDVYLYEAAERLGGQTNTAEWKVGKYKSLVDVGFMVMNSATCPNFLTFLDKVHARTAATEMTLGVSRDQGTFEWAGTNLGAIFCHRRHLLSPRMWRIVFDMIRFNHFALDALVSDDIESPSAGASEAKPASSAEETIDQYLEREGYSDAFRNDYLLPLTAGVWGANPDKGLLEFPAATLIRSLWNHHLLSTLSPRPQWLIIPDGSKAYIDAIMKGFPSNHRFLNTTVISATNDEDGRVRLHFEGGRSEIYDHVILATHGDEAYSIVQGSATPEEKQIMSRFRTSEHSAVLHSDISLMPRSQKAWSSCNYLTQSSPKGSNKGNTAQVTLTYNMNLVQHIPKHVFGDVLVTLDPLHEPDLKTVQGRYTYRRPLYNASTIRAQQSLPRIQNTRGISYAGAWTKNGNHEDAFSSGLSVAQDHLGAKLPFQFEDSSFSRGKKPELGLAELAVRLLILIFQVFFIEVVDRAVEGYNVKTRRQSPLVNGLGGRMKHKKVC